MRNVKLNYMCKEAHAQPFGIAFEWKIMVVVKRIINLIAVSLALTVWRPTGLLQGELRRRFLHPLAASLASFVLLEFSLPRIPSDFVIPCSRCENFHDLFAPFHIFFRLFSCPTFRQIAFEPDWWTFLNKKLRGDSNKLSSRSYSVEWFASDVNSLPILNLPPFHKTSKQLFEWNSRKIPLHSAITRAGSNFSHVRLSTKVHVRPARVSMETWKNNQSENRFMWPGNVQACARFASFVLFFCFLA